MARDQPSPFRLDVTVDPGEEGSLRAVASRTVTPTITVEMGEAHRFQPGPIARALRDVERVLATYGVVPDGAAAPPFWRKAMGPTEEKRWIRAGAGGLVEME